jgi:hypothetical protein
LVVIQAGVSDKENDREGQFLVSAIPRVSEEGVGVKENYPPIL